jgi:hypothetical protein
MNIHMKSLLKYEWIATRKDMSVVGNIATSRRSLIGAIWGMEEWQRAVRWLAMTLSVWLVFGA